MVAFRFLLIFVVIFLFAEHALAFETITEGKEYKFKYHLDKSSTVKRGSKETDSYQEFEGNLTIKALPGNILECQMTEVEGTGIDNLDELRQKFIVKLDGENVLELNNTVNSTDDTNWMLLEMIEEIIMDRSDIVRSIKEGHYDGKAQIEMLIVGKCESELKKIWKEDKTLYRARSIVFLCVIKEEALAQVRSMGFEDIPKGGITEVELTYDTVSNKQIGLSLFVKLQYILNQFINIDYLGSNDIAP